MAATRRATVLLPDPAGPSMAMVSGDLGWFFNRRGMPHFARIDERFRHQFPDRKSTSAWRLGHHVEAAVHVKNLARDARRGFGKQECGGRAHLRRINITL